MRPQGEGLGLLPLPPMGILTGLGGTQTQMGPSQVPVPRAMSGLPSPTSLALSVVGDPNLVL